MGIILPFILQLMALLMDIQSHSHNLGTQLPIKAKEG